MNILFVIPSGYIKPYPSLGVLYLASNVEIMGHNAYIVDLNIMNYKEIKEIIRRNIEIAAISCSHTAQINEVIKVSKYIKKINNNIEVIVGGNYASADYDNILNNHESVDVVVVGEGEETLLDITSGNNYKSIKGIAFRSDGRIIKNNKRDNIENLDDIEFPARHLINMKKYRNREVLAHCDPPGWMVTSRGCPYDCIFCSANVVFGRSCRYRSIINIIDEIEIIRKKYSIKRFAFTDDTFTSRKELIELCQAIEKCKITFSCFGRINDVDKNKLIALKKAGCRWIQYGIESGNQNINKRIKKNINLENAEEMIRLSKEIGLLVRCFFILGFPWDNHETIKDTINYALRVNPHSAIFSIAIPYHGSEYYDLVKNDLKYKEPKYFIDTYSKRMQKGMIPYVPPKINIEDLFKYQKIAYNKFYLRFSVIKNKINFFNYENRINYKFYFEYLFRSIFN